MKTLIIFLATAMLSMPTLANDTHPLKTQLSKSLSYPKMTGTENLEGLVAVAIRIDEEGNATVAGLNASDHRLGDYVRNRVAQLPKMTNAASFGQEYCFKIRFERE